MGGGSGAALSGRHDDEVESGWEGGCQEVSARGPHTDSPPERGFRHNPDTNLSIYQAQNCDFEERHLPTVFFKTFFPLL